MKGSALRDRAGAGLLALGTLGLAWPLVSGRLLAGHDVTTYLMYAQQVAANAREGILLPSWAADLNAGYGGPGLLLYPPLVGFLHAAPLAAGLPAPIALGLVAVLGLLLSGLAAWTWLRAEGWGSAAIPAALLYMAAPYRMLDLYERTNLSEHWAFVFPPLVLAAAALPLSRPARALVAAGGVAGLLLTNTPFGLLFAPLLGALLVSGRTAGKRLELTGGALLGVALSAILLVPQAAASGWVATDLWYGPASLGFRPSQNTLFSRSALDGPFNARVSAAIVGMALLALAALLAARGEGRRGRLLWGGAALASFLLALPPSGALWEAVPLLSRLQFPWRIGTILTLSIAALVARASRPWLAWTVAGLGFLGTLPFLGISTTSVEEASAPPVRPSAPCAAAPDPVAVAEAWGNAPHPRIGNPRLWDIWYLPRTASPGLAMEALGQAPPVYPELRDQGAVVPAAPGAPVGPGACGRLERDVEVVLAAPARVVVRSILVPGISGRLDGRPVPPLRDPLSGLLAVDVPAGTHRVGWEWRAPPPVVAGRWISAAAAVAFAALALAAARRPEGGPTR